MQDGNLKVNHGGLSTASQDLVKAATDVDNRLNQLEGDLEKILPDFTGQAKEAYHTAKKNWELAMRDMKDLLKDIGVAVDQSNTSYLEADLRGANRFRG